MMLVTTSRAPSANTRAFARLLSNLVPNSEYSPRGKKSVESLVEQARLKGLPRIAFVNDMKGNPGKIQFISVAQKSWDWDEKILLITSCSFAKTKQKASELSIEGAQSKTYEQLFNAQPAEQSDVTLKTSVGEFSFASREKELLKAKVKIVSVRPKQD